MRQDVIRIVDDDRALLNSQRYFLELAGYTVAVYSSCLEFLQKDDFRNPGCLILDVRMPEMTGLQLQTVLNQRGVTLPIIFLSAHGDINMAVHTLQQGADTFLEKPADPDRLLAAIEKAVEHCRRISRQQESLQSDRQRFEELTQREKEVMILVARGQPNKSIAQQLDIALPTVKMHRLRAMTKLGMKSAVEVGDLLRRLGEN